MTDTAPPPIEPLQKRREGLPQAVARIAPDIVARAGRVAGGQV